MIMMMMMMMTTSRARVSRTMPESLTVINIAQLLDQYNTVSSSTL